MFDLPKDTSKIVEFVLLFLPGFVTLGIVVYLTGVVISDFAFTYTAVALSLFIYLCASALRPRLFGVRREVSQGSHVMQLASIVFLVTGLLSISISYVYEANFVRPLFTGALGFSHVTADQPLVHLIKQERNRKDVDERPASLRLLTGETENGCGVVASEMWVRVNLSDAIYEGHIHLYNDEYGKNGLPVMLAPACRVDAKTGEYQLVMGPGVLVMEKDLKAIEFTEKYANGCFRLMFDADNKPPTQCVEPRVDIQGRFLKRTPPQR